ncbi:NACHT domain-containing protein [Nostoc sp. CENA67]|uniref:NACHT domain-containing protein n=1 Tax=Amazonocrinis nigriterrae CENA67 TaxID=2794033 RepID=A0A8J7L9N1_9NOST|nr:NACHT domain-containing protein [Amazonocrinis nigriterrae]MBH8564623.1 NACHT domain-containing protein [Amazonocrinis nigriterrae CENA67]
MDPEKILKFFDQLNKLISTRFFQGKEPTWLSRTADYFLVIISVLIVVWVLLFILSQIKKIWVEQFWPIFYNQEERRRSRKRQRFAQYIEHEIRQLNNREEWKDYRFTELEAEVEAEGKRKGFPLLPFFQLTQKGLRREQSLSKALELSRERLILAEGEPGSGKSVALRHVAEKMAQRAMKNRSIKSIIPLYINLKKLERSSKDKIDSEQIKSFIKQELNRVNDRDIEEFLEEEFQRGIKEGTWLFLFDSFDELPEVLSSVEADEAIRNYAVAIDDFLSGFNQCRGIIASRQFRGPKHLGWPRFRILPLENDRLKKLIYKAELEQSIERNLIGQLEIAPQEILEMSRNPMFLGILCENMRSGNPFPQNTHSVFESYLEKRLTRDEERLKRRFNLEPPEVRANAEKVAFCMSVDPGLGLSPTRESIQSAMGRLGFRVPGHFEQLLNALEYLKLARSETETIPGEAQLFTFAHRRFQEYFATCVVLREPHRISPRQLLTDGRWRETTVVIFHTQPPEVFAHILDDARLLLDEILGNFSGLIDDPVEYVNRKTPTRNNSILKPFSWPFGILHLLGLLQDGFISRIKDLPDDIQTQVARFLLSTTTQGTLSDQKWSLEVAGITPQPVLLWLLRHAFASESQWMKEVAYRQTARLGKIPDDVAADIRKALLSLFARNRLYQERFATHAHLSRLDQAGKYINTMRLLQWIKPIDLILHIVLFLWLVGILMLRNITFVPSITIATLIATVLIVSHLTLGNFAESNILYLNLPWGQIKRPSQQKRDSKLNFVSVFIRFAFFTLFWNTSTIICILVFSLLWSIFAILAANTGQFTAPVYWVLLVIFPLLYLIYNYKRIIEICIYILKNIWIYLITFFYILYIKIRDFMINNPESTINQIGLYFSIIYTTCFCIYLLYIGCKSSFYWVKDSIQWQKWIRNRPSQITGQELLNLIKLYHYPAFCKRMTTVIYERNLLPAIEESEDLINELALALERSLFFEKRKANIRQKKWQKILKNPIYAIKALFIKFHQLPKKSPIARTMTTANIYSGSEFFNSWLKQYTFKDKRRFIKLGSEFLDEVNILLEQLRAKRQVSERS